MSENPAATRGLALAPYRWRYPEGRVLDQGYAVDEFRRRRERSRRGIGSCGVVRASVSAHAVLEPM